MIYLYQCPNCDREFEIIKPVSLIDKIEYCEDCQFPMERQICPPAVCSVDNFKADYYHTFGKVIKSKQHLKNELSRYKGETGAELIEVGTEKIPKKPKKKTEY